MDVRGEDVIRFTFNGVAGQCAVYEDFRAEPFVLVNYQRVFLSQLSNVELALPTNKEER